LSISNSTLTGNFASNNGGVVYSDAAATNTSITGSTITDNSSNGYGGAMFVQSGSTTLTGDTITQLRQRLRRGAVRGRDREHGRRRDDLDQFRFRKRIG
jgi:hypothetical protein